MIKHIFLDLDDTILDFHKAENAAIEKTLAAFSIPVTEENKALYSRINKGCWEALERGEITREEAIEKIRKGETSLAELAAYAEAMGAPALPGSGRQEYLEGVVNSVLCT